jgi:hypothetical protein
MQKQGPVRDGTCVCFAKLADAERFWKNFACGKEFWLTTR